MNTLNDTGARALRAASIVPLIIACLGACAGGASAAGGTPQEGSTAGVTDTPRPTGEPTAADASTTGEVKPPEAIYGDWHEDFRKSTDQAQIFVPSSVELGPAHYRRTLKFGRDGSFATLVLDPADAHYECAGTFTATAADTLAAQCNDPKTKEIRKYAIRILEATRDRLAVQIQA